MKLFHITAGVLALVFGAVALYAAKGSPLHRRSGVSFVVAMLAMTSSAVVMAAFLEPNPVNVIAGSLTFYLVCTGMLTVRRQVAQARRLVAGLMLLALAGGAYAFALGLEALGSVDGKVAGIPPQPLFMFAAVGLLGALLDARLLWAGDIQGPHRLARHLWRMCFALWIATASFFLGQAKFFPEPIRHSGVLAIPVLLVAGMMFYWLVRVLRKRRSAVMAQTR